ncbi:MAG TPA: DUF1361 domain-containing protein [Bacteroidia bacterium]|nr:DUF1361 domain-containing protein [Bacteroidia bacterium]
MSIFCLAFSLVRFFITGTKVYLFLNWNLFLAFIPWCLGTIILIKGYEKKKIAFVTFLFCWLLFFPNSPYILTDFFHLKDRSFVPLWFDWALILSFAWTGLVYGFSSLADIEQILLTKFKKRHVTLLVIAFLFLSGFGVYIGRFLRWNSWDVISNPLIIASDISIRIIHPFLHARTWLITLIIGLLLNMMYFSFKYTTLSQSKG